MNIFETIINLFINLLSKYFTQLDYLLYIALGLFIVAMMIIYIMSANSYEVRANKALSNINAYLVANQYIKEDNLVAFNKLMKSAPSDIRYQWQQYVLNRDKEPSKYLSRENCVEKPLQTSTYHRSITLLKSLTTILCLLVFIVGIVLNADKIVGYEGTIYSIAILAFRIALLPALIIIIASIYGIFLNSRVNSLTASIYQAFYDFERNIDKAVTTLPEYIDYETLFTKQEIKTGIPLLQEYLERRDRQQQEEIKRAMEREAEHEKYNFDSTGIDGSLLLERAMKESELFIVNRKRLLAEIEQLETEKENNKKNFDNATKEVNRKLQATKENLAKFKTQQEQSLNRIETNYIRKQQAEEVRKQQELERDLEEAISKYDEAQASIDREIQSRKDEIQENKKYVETAMLSEFETFTEKTYKILYDNVENKLSERINEIKENTEDQQHQIEDLTIKLAEKEDNENKIVDEYEVTLNELDNTKRKLEDLQKLYDQNEMLYNQLLVKFSALNAGEIKVEGYKVVVSPTDDVIKQVKDEILGEIVANSSIVTGKKNDSDNEEKVIKEEPVAVEQKDVNKEVEAPKSEQAKPIAKQVSSASKKPATAKTSTAKKPATKTETVKKRKTQSDKTAEPKGEADKAEELKKKRAETRKKKKEEENKKKQDALLEIQRRIDEENSRLVQQHNALKEFIDSTIKVINEDEPKEQVEQTSKNEVKPATEQESFDSVEDMFNHFNNPDNK